MSAAMNTSRRSWSVDAFAEFWANPDAVRLSTVRAVIADDIVGFWPRPIGVVRAADAYQKVIEAVVTARPQMLLRIGEHANTGDFTFIRWIATGNDDGETFEFNGCDRVRTRNGIVCENYVFCDHPHFEVVAKRLRDMS